MMLPKSQKGKTYPCERKGPDKEKGQRRAVRKRKASEPGDVRLGQEMARPSKKSQKFTLGGLDRDSGAAEAGGVREDSGLASIFYSKKLSLSIKFSN
jgi:hypothetical protein